MNLLYSHKGCDDWLSSLSRDQRNRTTWARSRVLEESRDFFKSVKRLSNNICTQTIDFIRTRGSSIYGTDATHAAAKVADPVTAGLHRFESAFGMQIGNLVSVQKWQEVFAQKFAAALFRYRSNSVKWHDPQSDFRSLIACHLWLITFQLTRPFRSADGRIPGNY